ncbi:MAG: DUF5615 family PIN-like protein [Deltaproteobacteria bacterium]|nr:DUF5615 family PIN-like protein [Deltaproteobacteria bacterium]
MKVLIDSCVWGGAAAEIAGAGHDVVSVADVWAEDPGDEQVLNTASAEGRVLVTLDKDFGELAVVRGVRHAGIVRLVGLGAREQGGLCVWAIKAHADELGDGAIVTVEPGRIRIRPPASEE